MVYTGVQREDLPKKYLEISVWSFNIYAPHDPLGQVVIHLSGELQVNYNEVARIWLSLCQQKTSSWTMTRFGIHWEERTMSSGLIASCHTNGLHDVASCAQHIDLKDSVVHGQKRKYPHQLLRPSLDFPPALPLPIRPEKLIITSKRWHFFH